MDNANTNANVLAQDKITALLSDPENVKMLAKIAAGFMSTPDNAATAANEAKPEPDPTAEPETEPVSVEPLAAATDAPTAAPLATPFSELGKIIGGNNLKLPKDGEIDKSIVLLNALKPYLGAHKRELCDVFVKLLGGVKMAKVLGIYNAQ